MNYIVNPSVWSMVFPIPAEITDKHIKLCSGVALKCLLLLLRSPGEYGDLNALAKKLGQPSGEIADALNYWEEQGILIPCEKGAVPAFAPTAACRPETAPKAEDTAPAAVKAAPAPSRPRFPRDEALALINGDDTLRSLMQELQGVFGKPLTSADADVLVALYSFYHLSAHYILSLVHYCIETGKNSMSYAEKVAVSWINEGVDDSKVDEHIDRLYLRRTNEGKIRRLFGIGERSLTSNEKKYIASWFGEMGFDTDVIGLAYERTVDLKGKLIFSYINGILSDWHKKGIGSVEQAKNESAPEKPAAKPPKNQPSGEIDIKLIEQFMKT